MVDSLAPLVDLVHQVLSLGAFAVQRCSLHRLRSFLSYI